MSYEELKAKYGSNWGIGDPKEEQKKRIIEDLLHDYELACKEAEKWWIEYKARKAAENVIP